MQFTSPLLKSLTPTFPTTYNNHLTSISQWQYWWWFWFSFLLALYAVFFIRMAFNRTLSSNPKIVTSYRSHGRWGDLLVCLIPVFWCINILANSHFLLRALEWQTETSFLTLRVRGKQWYWVYKYNVRTYKDTMDLHILIGHNIKKRVDKNFMTNWEAVYSRVDSIYKRRDRNAELFDKLELSKSASLLSTKLVDGLPGSNVVPTTCISTLFKTSPEQISSAAAVQDLPTLPKQSPRGELAIAELPALPLNSVQFCSESMSQTNSGSVKSERTLHRWVRDSFQVRNNIELFKNDLNVLLHNKQLLGHNVISQNLAVRNTEGNVRSTIKQEKFKVDRLSSKLNTRPVGYAPDWTSTLTTNPLYLNKSVTPVNGVLQSLSASTAAKYHYMTGSLKPTNQAYSRSDAVRSYYHNKRLLWVNKQIILPTDMPLTIITNSYDVIHSWFLPGLGLKLDCVPGRATHHTIYIERSGYYYGQCAEICGRRHHHMPIKILALPFSHFLYWWNIRLGNCLAERHQWVLDNPYSDGS